jgi:hypothetical protein
MDVYLTNIGQFLEIAGKRLKNWRSLGALDHRKPDEFSNEINTTQHRDENALDVMLDV